MIIFDLACSTGHRFEGWFASAEDFARQSDGAMVRCPVCDTHEVTRIPSARVHVGTSVETRPAQAVTSPPDAVAGLPSEILGKLRELIRSTENVGRRFPEEARRIHYNEVPARAIRGQASPRKPSCSRRRASTLRRCPISSRAIRTSQARRFARAEHIRGRHGLFDDCGRAAALSAALVGGVLERTPGFSYNRALSAGR